ncbi:MAG: hypothetical protein IPI87_04390 [Betaproteobacteria bacterium]|nr:hypothetical protein [Betaproteobacteria bacterium]
MFSTVGDLRVFERLPQGRVRPALAIRCTPELAEARGGSAARAAHRFPAEPRRAGERLQRATDYPIQHLRTLFAGINDGDDEVDGLARLLAGKYAVMNLIHQKRRGRISVSASAPERAVEDAHAVYRRGVSRSCAISAGWDVGGGGGCYSRGRVRLDRRP